MAGLLILINCVLNNPTLEILYPSFRAALSFFCRFGSPSQPPEKVFQDLLVEVRRLFVLVININQKLIALHKLHLSHFLKSLSLFELLLDLFTCYLCL